MIQSKKTTPNTANMIREKSKLSGNFINSPVFRFCASEKGNAYARRIPMSNYDKVLYRGKVCERSFLNSSAKMSDPIKNSNPFDDSASRVLYDMYDRETVKSDSDEFGYYSSSICGQDRNDRQQRCPHGTGRNDRYAADGAIDRLRGAGGRF